MSESVKLRSDITSQYIDGYGGDWLCLDAAKVSSKHSEGSGPRDLRGTEVRTLRSLVKRRHGSPFKHGGQTWYVECPIFVMREMRTHFVSNFQLERGDGTWEIVEVLEGFEDLGYSEASGRYRPFDKVFWVPDPSRPMVIPEGGFNPMAPEFVAADPGQHAALVAHLQATYNTEWGNYQAILDMGFPPEIARASLGHSVYSAMYMTLNPLSAMRLMTLRVKSEDSTYPTYPLLECQRVVEPIESQFRVDYPETYRAFVDGGRVSP